MIALLIVILLISLASTGFCIYTAINIKNKTDIIIKNNDAVTELYKEIADLRKDIIHENVGFIEKETFDDAHKDFVIICKEGSYAEEYAKENRIKFSYIK